MAQSRKQGERKGERRKVLQGQGEKGRAARRTFLLNLQQTALNYNNNQSGNNNN